MMVSLDVYRPAAQEQLKLLGEQNNILTLPIVEGQQPLDICRRALSAANLNGSEVIIFDTAGRTQIDLQMMSEIKQIEQTINPSETLLVADSLTGQVAANVAKEFKSTVNLTGIVLTRSDGDGRGGAALSMKYVSQVPIKFLGVGEKIENLEEFHPERIANRILGMGDIVSLVEKATQDIDEENLKKTEEKLKKGQFSLDDYLSQLRQMKKMGGIEGIMSFLPGVSKIKNQMDQAGVDEKIVSKNEAVILSMTKKERSNPKIIDFIREYFEQSRIMLSGRPIVHIQGPATRFKNGYFGLPPHQDFPSTQGSTDGLVIWIPLINISSSSYPIMIAPNSHKNKKIHPYYVNEQSAWVVKNESVPLCNFKEVICKKGDVVVFDVFAVHKSSTSGDNTNRIAVSQRVDNCSDPIFLERGFPTGYNTVVKRKETGALLPDTNLIPNLFEK